MTTAASTDIFTEVHRLINEAVHNAGSEYHSGQLAAETLERIRLDHPEIYGEWTDTLAIDQIRTLIGQLRNQQRRRQASAPRLSAFDITESVDGSHTQRRIGDMTRPEVAYAARSYEKRASANSLRAARLAALRDRLPDDTTLVRDVVSEDEIAAIYND